MVLLNGITRMPTITCHGRLRRGVAQEGPEYPPGCAVGHKLRLASAAGRRVSLHVNPQGAGEGGQALSLQAAEHCGGWLQLRVALADKGRHLARCGGGRGDQLRQGRTQGGGWGEDE